MKIALMILVLCAHGFALADEGVGDIFADECGESSTFVLPFTFAANSADQVLCLNSLQGQNDSADRKTALDCFLGPRIQKSVSSNHKYSDLAACKDRFLKLCTELRRCKPGEEDDLIFGGKKLFCGHLGRYLDFLWRIQGGLPQTFNDIDGANVCKIAVN